VRGNEAQSFQHYRRIGDPLPTPTMFISLKLIELQGAILSPLDHGRLLMAVTQGFHSLFIILGVGLSAMMSIAEFLGILKKRNEFSLMARRWSYGFSLMFGVGAASGTAVAFELYLLWTTFMNIATRVVALPFFLEVVFGFFPEAIFLPIYYYGWNTVHERDNNLSRLCCCFDVP
jgi:cytochrome d ubiquinol oxidase subunit I